MTDNLIGKKLPLRPLPYHRDRVDNYSYRCYFKDSQKVKSARNIFHFLQNMPESSESWLKLSSPDFSLAKAKTASRNAKSTTNQIWYLRNALSEWMIRFHLLTILLIFSSLLPNWSGSRFSFQSAKRCKNVESKFLVSFPQNVKIWI